MAQNINEPVPTPGPSRAISAYTDAGATTKPDNIPGVIFSATSRITGTYNSDIMYNPTAKGVRLMLTISPTGAATGTYNMSVQVPDNGDETIWKPLLGTLATGVTGDGTGALTGAILTVYPGLTGIADGSAANGPTTVNQHLGLKWRVQVVTTLATLTFRVSGNYLL
mgnify:FL=1